MLKIIHEHISIAGQLEWSAIVLNLVVNIASELSPILPVQTADVGTVEIGKRRSRQMGPSLGERPLRRIAQSTATGEQGLIAHGQTQPDFRLRHYCQAVYEAEAEASGIQCGLHLT